MYERIFETFLSLCRAFTVPPAWKAMGTDKFAYVAPTSPEECSRKMLADHAEHELVEAGLFRRIDGALRLHPGLAIPGATLIALTEPKSGRIFEVVTDAGCITSDLIPSLLMPDDQVTQAAFSSSRTLYVTENVMDCVLLRSLGLAAAPAGDFTTLGDRGLQLLCKFFEINVPSMGGCVPKGEPMANGYQVARRQMEDYHKRYQRIDLVVFDYRLGLAPSGGGW